MTRNVQTEDNGHEPQCQEKLVSRSVYFEYLVLANDIWHSRRLKRVMVIGDNIQHRFLNPRMSRGFYEELNASHLYLFDLHCNATVADSHDVQRRLCLGIHGGKD